MPTIIPPRKRNTQVLFLTRRLPVEPQRQPSPHAITRKLGDKRRGGVEHLHLVFGCASSPMALVPCRDMRTLVLDPPTAGLEPVLERRRRSGLDRMDEIWEGVYHMVPAPSHAHASIEWQLAALLRPAARAAGLEATGQCNLGESEHDFRVPDGALHRPGASGTWHPTAALVVEIVSPGDETWQKLPFYAVHRVDEVLIVDPAERAVHWLGLTDDGRYRPLERSGVIDLGPGELSQGIDWPAVEKP